MGRAWLSRGRQIQHLPAAADRKSRRRFGQHQQVKAGAWRILVGQDATALDTALRAQPEAAYDYPTLARAAAEAQATISVGQVDGS